LLGINYELEWCTGLEATAVAWDSMIFAADPESIKIASVVFPTSGHLIRHPDFSPPRK
jgi:hypothetical protein